MGKIFLHKEDIMPEEQRSMLSYTGDTAPVRAYLSRPAGDEPRPAIIVIHEIYGLTPHIQDVADRFAAQGYVALAPHLFSRPGLDEVLTPAAVDAYFRFRATIPPERQADLAFAQQELAKLPPDQRRPLDPGQVDRGEQRHDEHDGHGSRNPAGQ